MRADAAWRSSVGAAIGGRLGFGCARLFGGSEELASSRILEAALEAGIRHFDTAPSYGSGRSEEVLGGVVQGVPDITIATKVGIPRPPNNPAPTSGVLYRRYLRSVLASMPLVKSGMLSVANRIRKARETGEESTALVRLSVPALIEELETSLRLLRRDRVEILFLHEPDQIDVQPELVSAMEKLKREGAIGAIGYAYGDLAGPVIPAVSVVQSRYVRQGGVPFRNDVLRIFHGTMRQDAGQAHGKEGRRKGPAGLIDAMRDHPDAAFLFSASSPRQVQQLVRTAVDEGVFCAP